LMTFTGRPNAFAKSNPVQPPPRFTGSMIGCPHRIGPGKPIETASYFQSAVLSFTSETSRSGVKSFPDGNLREASWPVASSLTFVPPMSMTRMFMSAPPLKGIEGRPPGRHVQIQPAPRQVVAAALVSRLAEQARQFPLASLKALERQLDV